MEKMLANDIVINFIVSTLTALVTYVLTFKKRKSESTSDELENVSKAIETYRKMLDDLANRYAKVVQELDEAYKIIGTLREKLNLLEQQNKNFKQH